MNETTFQNKCVILAELWLDYRDFEQFEEFIEYCDLGLPLAYAISNGIVEKSDRATKFIDETFDLFLTLLKLEDDNYDNLSDLLELYESTQE